MKNILTLLLALVSYSAFTQNQSSKPNIIFILADDLGYGDLGCFGSPIIKTPNLDKMASEGLKLTNFHSGSTVCAPSRYSFFTGKHMGTSYIRGNGEIPLRKQDIILPQYLKAAGYQTGLFGKWGLGDINTEGIPSKKGWDYFAGYLHHIEAHYPVPSIWWKSSPTSPIPSRLDPKNGFLDFANDNFIEEGMQFVKNRDQKRPFFMMFSVSMPHADLRVPESTLKQYQTPDGASIFNEVPYAGYHYGGNLMPKATYAAMVTHLDSYVGKIRAFLKEQGLDKNTLIVFSSDNGTHTEGGRTKSDVEFMKSSGIYRGVKRDLYEGGIRVPTIVWGAGMPENQVKDQPGAFWDLLPTFLDLSGIKSPTNVDGISLVNYWKKDIAPKSRPLYWEFYELGFKQAVLKDNLKYLRFNKANGDIKEELYDLSIDPSESQDISGNNPEKMAEFQKMIVQLRKKPEHALFRRALDK
ncbi:MAG: arylsulfatase [Leadbetterella sp.]